MALISASIAQNIGALLSLVCALVTVAASEDAAVTATTVDSEVAVTAASSDAATVTSARCV